MIITCNKSQKSIRSLLLQAFLSLFIVIISQQHSNAQEQTNDLQFFFVKSSDSLKTSQLYFNVLKILNNSAKTITGDVTFSGPENWKIITFPISKLFINPGDTITIPVRVSPATDAIGGIAYVLSASFRTTEKVITANTYITLPSKQKWDFSATNTNVFFTEYSPNATMLVNLSNKGNTNELIKINLQIGKLLLLQNNNEGEYSEFINLPAFKDTTITYTFVYNKNLNASDISRFESSWRESAIVATASTETVQKSSTVSIRKLKSSYLNLRNQSSSPLNLDFQVYNLMSNQKARFNFKTYGTVLFPKNRDVQYLIGVHNIYFNGESNQNFDINRQLVYSLRYFDKKNRIQVSYNINGGELHTINGRGIEGTYALNKRNKISYALIQNPFNRSVGEYLGYSTIFRKIMVNGGLTNENSAAGEYAATSIQLGTGFSFLKYHNLSVQLLGSRSNFKQADSISRDTSVIGYSYRIFYNLRYKKIDFRINGINSTNNYIRNSGMQQVYLDGRYTLNEKVRFALYGNHQYYSATRYPYNFYNPVNYSSNDYLKQTTSISAGSVIYQVGPIYTGSMRQSNNPVTGYNSEYKTFQPGIWGAITFRMKGYRSISPNLSISNLRLDYSSDEPDAIAYSLKNNIFYTAGVNYYDNLWKVNAYYTSGTSTDLYRSLQIDEKPVLSRSIQIRPSFEKYFFDRKVKISAYANYAYYMPSGRENISYSLRYDHYMKKGWTLYLNGFMYSNTRVTEESGRVNSKDLNLIAGITKSFELQQPRQKYYDFKAVFFNDLDGNLIKSDNEPPVANILVNIEKDRSVSGTQSTIPQIDLISDVHGEIYFENLPKDNYKLTFTPLVNLQSLYFLNGSEQSVFNDEQRIFYIPLAESYKIKGKIILVRDPNSSEGKISLSGIRVTVHGANGETYSSLTDKFGYYIVNIPKADKFKVSVNNVFGEQFSIENDEMEVQFNINKTINLDFTFFEKRREIKFNNGDDYSKVTSGKVGTNP